MKGKETDIKLEDPLQPNNFFSRRQIVQSTALVAGLTIGGNEAAESSSFEGEGGRASRLAQAATGVGPRAPATPPQIARDAGAAVPIDLQAFIDLSRVLTGVDDIEADLAAQYLQRCADNPEVSSQLQALVQALSLLKGDRRAVERGFRDKMNAEGVESTFFGAAEQIIYLWYIGAFFRKKDPAKADRYWDYGLPEHYFRGKVWSVIGTTPPMTAHKSLDHWTRPIKGGA
jgi:hypothetical protein